MNVIMKDGHVEQIPTPNFILIGATTKIGDISRPLRTRFGLMIGLEPYSVEDLATIVINKGEKNEIFFSHEAAVEIARRSRSTARTAEKLMSRVQDYALIRDEIIVGPELVIEVMNNLDIDQDGLTEKDREFMQTIHEKFQNNPVSLSSIAACMNDSIENLYETVEPFLIQKGFIYRTPRGRVLTPLGLAQLN
jgi:Holliday junction DNA helicase RuvB